MSAFRLDRLLDLLTTPQLVVGLLWLGLAIFTVTLVILMETRWGQSRPLRKCVVLSLLAHLLLIGFATTKKFVFATPLPDEPVFDLAFVEGPVQQAARLQQVAVQQEPWEQILHDSVAQPEPVEPEPREPLELPEPERTPEAQPADLPVEPPLENLPLPEAEHPEPKPPAADGPTGRPLPGRAMAEAIEAPPAQQREPPRVNLPEQPIPGPRVAAAGTQPQPTRARTAGVPTALLEQLAPLPQLAAKPTTPDPADSLAALVDRSSRPGRAEPVPTTAGQAERPTSVADMAHAAAKGTPTARNQGVWKPSIASVGPRPSSEDDPAVAAGQGGAIPVDQRPRDRQGTTGAGREMPDIYRLRVAPDRSRLAQRQGATPETEAAVRAALKWLADGQQPDGRWDASDHGGGRELLVAGRNRLHAGIEADTGMTGLALLAFLASGHTHLEGRYRENVRLGLQYLLTIQARDGNLAGRSSSYARMYCHSMAAFALSEAYGMTGDERLREAVRRAVAYTAAAQDPSGGGWRYKPRDPGDTSQAGWQLMALKSAELAGIPIPVKTRNGLIRFLRTVSAGKHGGLASYRPNEPVSRPMTAEALVCWQFLGLPREHPAGNEAGDYLLGELPGEGEKNLYYWYYATLGMYQLQDIYWQRWNEALRTTLVESQRKTGPLAGSWDHDTVWGGYGGRVYSTALAALCLEVYYRFLPLYVEAGAAARNSE